MISGLFATLFCHSDYRWSRKVRVERRPFQLLSPLRHLLIADRLGRC